MLTELTNVNKSAIVLQALASAALGRLPLLLFGYLRSLVPYGVGLPALKFGSRGNLPSEFGS